MNDLGRVLEEQMGNPSRYGATEVQNAYRFMQQDLQDQANTARSSATADAARRGVYYGSPLTTSLGDIETQYQRGLGGLASSLAMDQARTYGEDQNRAIGNVFRFGENQQSQDRFRANLGLDTARLGYQNAPNWNAMATGFPGGDQGGGGVDWGAIAGLAGTAAGAYGAYRNSRNNTTQPNSQ